MKVENIWLVSFAPEEERTDHREDVRIVAGPFVVVRRVLWRSQPPSRRKTEVGPEHVDDHATADDVSTVILGDADADSPNIGWIR